MRWTTRLVLAMALALACAASAAAAVAVRYDGIASDEDGRFVYRETHHVERADDGAGERVVLYRCEDGRAFARKLVRYTAGSLAPDFALEDARTGYREGVRSQGGERRVFVKAGPKRERSAALPRVAGLVADAGFDDFIARNWDALAAGRSVQLPFLVPGELDALVFKVRREREASVDGDAALVFRLSLGAWYGRFLPHIDVAYRVEDRLLLRYEGVSNLRDLKLDNLDVRIAFSPAARAPLDAASRDAARSEPLVRRCD